MGEIAEMMLEGTLCEGCGEYIGTNNGYASYCSDQCANDRGGYSKAEHRILKIGIDRAICKLEIVINKLRYTSLQNKEKSLLRIIKKLETLKGN